MWSVQTDMWGVYRSRGSLVVERGKEGGERKRGGDRERERGREREREGGRERERGGGGGGSEIEGEWEREGGGGVSE